MPAILGLDCKLYRNTGTYAAPTWDEVTNCRDATLNMEKGEADVTTRANSGWRAVKGALKDASVDFSMVWSAGDADFEAFRDAFLNNTLIDVAVMDGDITVSGNQGLRAEMEVLGFTRNEALEEAVTVDVRIRPGYSANAPAWMEI